MSIPASQKIGKFAPTSPRPLVLLIGDGTSSLDQIGARLVSGGYRTSQADTIPAIWRRVIEDQPFAVVMDATDPHSLWRPWDLCRELAESRAFLLILLTSENSPRDQTKALKYGADHCFAMRENSEAILGYLNAPKFRRDGENASHPPHRWIGMSVQIDWENREICRNGQVGVLSRKEFELLKLLVRHPGKTIALDTIYENLWKHASRASCQANLKQVVLRLRRKIEADPQHPQHILSSHGVGYRLLLTPGSR